MNTTEQELHAKIRRMFAASLRDMLAHQLLEPGHPRHGGWISPETGADEPAHVGQGFLYAHLFLACAACPGLHPRADLLCRLAACGTYWMAVRRPSGRIDLRNCNQDSGPDTAFLLQILLLCFELRRRLAPHDHELAAATTETEAFAQDAARALADGGVHTPNHRWVMVSAMAQACALWPELGPHLKPTLTAFTAEQPDIDAEGAFLERSVAVYDAVNVRSLLLAHETHGWPEGLAAAGRCLDFDLALYHPDGTVDTQLSHRYDFGSRPVPIGLIACYLQHARVAGRPQDAAHAAWMLSRADESNAQQRGLAFWLLLELFSGGSLSAAPAAPPDVEVHHAHNRIVRIRRGRTSLSLYGGVTRLASLVHGQATLRALMAGQSYLGHGRFVADRLHGSAGRYVLESKGRLEPHRLGYSQALGKPVPPADWDRLFQERELRALPDCASSLEVTWEAGAPSLTLQYRTDSGLPGVAAQISFDFEAGGIWETADTALKPVLGQVLVLRQEAGRMTYGGIGSKSAAARMDTAPGPCGITPPSKAPSGSPFPCGPRSTTALKSAGAPPRRRLHRPKPTDWAARPTREGEAPAEPAPFRIRILAHPEVRPPAIPTSESRRFGIRRTF